MPGTDEQKRALWNRVLQLKGSYQAATQEEAQQAIQQAMQTLSAQPLPAQPARPAPGMESPEIQALASNVSPNIPLQIPATPPETEEQFAERLDLMRPEAPPMQITDVSVGNRGEIRQTLSVDWRAIDALYDQTFPTALEGARNAYPNLTPAEQKDRALGFIMGRLAKSGMYPSKEWMANNIPKGKERMKSDFHALANRLATSPEFQAAVQADHPKLSKLAMDRAIRFRSYKYISQYVMNGYMPDDIREAWESYSERKLEGVSGELAMMGLDPQTAGADELAAATRRMLNREITQRFRGKVADIQAEFVMEPQRPITGSDRVKYGIPTSVKTYGDLAPLRLPTETERKTIKEAQQGISMVKSFENILFDEKSGIFSQTGRATWNRARGRLNSYQNAIRGTDLGENVRLYQDTRAAFAQYLAKQVEGGRMTDQDREIQLRRMPELKFLVQDSTNNARRKFDMMLQSMQEQERRLSEGLYLGPKSLPEGRTQEIIDAIKEIVK